MSAWEEFKKKQAEAIIVQNKDFVQLTDEDKQELRKKLIEAIAGVFGEITPDENGEGFKMKNYYNKNDHREILLLALTNYYYEVFLSTQNSEILEPEPEPETLEILYQMMRVAIAIAMNKRMEDSLKKIINTIDNFQEKSKEKKETAN